MRSLSIKISGIRSIPLILMRACGENTKKPSEKASKPLEIELRSDAAEDRELLLLAGSRVDDADDDHDEVEEAEERSEAP